MKTKNLTSRKTIIASLFLLCFFSQTGLFAQNYKSALGLKVGGPHKYCAVNYKVFFTKHISMEATFGKNLQVNTVDIPVQTLFEYNGYFQNESYSWYTGFGASAGYWLKGNFRNVEKQSPFWSSANSVIGIEHRMGFAPFSISADVGVQVRYFPDFHTNFTANLSIRYLFKNTNFSSRHLMSRKAYGRNYGRRRMF